ncbi:restriction endonuclease subunit S [Maribacter polysiphoniae]|uniref:Restriction endonuclease subunit S n=1 Tax=Maribacter polysiphoniae TaxID=429344 RepID=A0A316EQE2_9FLAO|nr:restriction endonuclease subunit S [Maribacter polysiphoniae]MBD1259816.1 restriction endonuclease subunit S [Maribacter polysiphoniae]PWK25270.1 type I restriction enzyme S subunit [Maribacter polysiphoniae]
MMGKEKLPQLRFSEFENGWIPMKYDEIYSFYSTNSLSRDKLNYESGQVKNIHYGDIHTKFDTLFDISKEIVPFVNDDIIISNIPSENYCQEGDLLIADASEDYKGVGKTIEIVNLDNEKVLAGLHTFLARPNKHNMAYGFAGFMLQSWGVREQVMKIAQGTKVLGLAKSRLAKIKLNIPSFPEQQKIASFLTAVDKKITQLNKKKVLLEQYKKGVMQRLFCQEVRFKDDDGKHYPEWKEKRLKEFILDFIVPMRDKPKDLTGEIPWCRIEDFDGKFLSKSKTNQGVTEKVVRQMNLKVYPVNTLLVSCSANLGFCAIVKKELITNQTFIGLFPDLNRINVDFLYHMMKLSSRRLNVLSSGTTISYLSRKQFENFEIPYPCIKEQNKIASYLSAIDDKINQVDSQIEKTIAFKKGLLQQMFV